MIVGSGDRYHVDHVRPLRPRAGDAPGTHEPANAQLLCPSCNLSKSNKQPEQFAQERGFLF